MQTNHLLLKSGGRITAIHSVAHSTYKGVASWYFLGDVSWTAEQNNGRAATLLNHEIPPYAVCYDGTNEETKAAAKEEVDKIMAELNAYLLDKGEWLKEPEHKKDGRVVNWKPKHATGLAPL